jgi:uncharacterized membrane protein
MQGFVSIKQKRSKPPQPDRPISPISNFDTIAEKEGNPIMGKNDRKLVRQLMQKGFSTLTQSEKRVLKTITEGLHISRNAIKDYEQHYTFGQRLADKVAAFGGSWTFIILFGAILLIWIAVNSFVFFHIVKQFDPYPYILLNLVLSMLAALQAPIIMMSQNRQAAKDRADAEHDYEVNLKAELEIMALHEKLDTMREKQLEKIVVLQQQQIDMIANFLQDAGLKPS